ncbi:MAG: hypothetical protein EBU84_20905, partial [Actinobacteria bacterium]|nr:hypothetical protein [Actinomycetota bacterium]
GSVHSADTLHRALEDAVALRAEVEDYLSRLPEEVARAVRHTMTSDLDYAFRNIPLALGRIEEAQARIASTRAWASARLAAWQATGVALKPRGSVIVWEGREYVVGDSWTRLVVHSGLEVNGELVDCTAVGVLDLNDPATGRTVLQ